MIHPHRHQDTYSHYLPYVILAIALVTLVLLLANMIPEVSRIELFPASSPAISGEPIALNARSLEVAGAGFLLNRDNPVLGYILPSELNARSLGVAGSGFLLNRDHPVWGYSVFSDVDPRSLGVAGSGFLLNRDNLSGD